MENFENESQEETFNESDAVPLFSSISTKNSHTYTIKFKDSGKPSKKLRYFRHQDAWRFVDQNSINNERPRQSNFASPLLFADDIWPGALVLADYLASNAHIIDGKTVCEIGAGECGLPSLLCCHLNAKVTTVTDYPSVSSLYM